jgi:hypothetical protein
MRPEAGPMASSIPISKWQAAVRKPDNPPVPSDLSGMMSWNDSTKVTSAQHCKSALGSQAGIPAPSDLGSLTIRKPTARRLAYAAGRLRAINRFPRNVMSDVTHIPRRSFVTKAIHEPPDGGKRTRRRSVRVSIPIPCIRVVVTSTVDHNPLVPAMNECSKHG